MYFILRKSKGDTPFWQLDINHPTANLDQAKSIAHQIAKEFDTDAAVVKAAHYVHIESKTVEVNPSSVPVDAWLAKNLVEEGFDE